MTRKTERINHTLSETFGVEEVMDVSPKNEIVEMKEIVIPEDASLESDAEAVRDTLYELLKTGAESFEDLRRIAVAEESPRAFEVMNAMLSNLSDIAVKLIDVQGKVKKIKQAEQKATDPELNSGNVTINNNTAFIGTTADLQDMIKKLTMENLDNE